MRWVRRLLVALVALSGTAGVAAAHEVGGSRFDAPVPVSLLYGGAAATVVLTALWLGYSDRVPEGSMSLFGVSSHAVRALRALAAAGFGALVVAAVLDGLTGSRTAAENLATVFVWPVWLKGLGLLAVLVGSPWRWLSPWRAIHRAMEFLEGSRLGAVPYPSWLGVWPALVGFVAAVGVVENLTVLPRSPALTAGLVALYAGVMVVGGLAFGREWFANADFLAVLYRLFGRVAPVELASETDDGGSALRLRYPWAGAAKPLARSGAAAFVVAMVYTVSFDGFASTPEYRALVFDVRPALGTGSLTSVVVYLVGLAAFLVTFYGTVRLVELVGDDDGAVTDGDRRTAANGMGPGYPAALAFAPTLLPIAAAYELAHNYPFVLRNLARMLELVAGALGSPTTITLLGWLTVPAFWASQAVLIVLGHVVAVVAAHAVATRRFRTLGEARRAHLPLVVLMVAYTVLSLWIVSRPVVTGA